MLHTVDTGTFRSLEMDLLLRDYPCFSTILVLKSPDNPLLFFLFSMVSVLHTTQRLSQLFSILTVCKYDFHIASTSYLPRVNLNTYIKEHHMLEMQLMEILTRASSWKFPNKPFTPTLVTFAKNYGAQLATHKI